MRTRKEWRGAVVLVGVLAAGLWTASADARPPGGRDAEWGRGGDEMLLPLLVRGVGLTEAQQAQVRQIVASHRPKFEALLRQLRAAREQLAEKLYAPGPVKAEDLTPLTQQIAKLREPLTQESLQVALEVRKVLTPDQLAKAKQRRQRLNELRAEMRSLLEEGH
jgi:Spy/CpxP family protein refolding chaperone